MFSLLLFPLFLWDGNVVYVTKKQFVCIPHSLDSDSSRKSDLSYSVKREIFFSAKSIKLKAWCQSLKTGIKWQLCLWVSPYGTLDLSICPFTSVIIFHLFFCPLPVLIQALLRRCQPPPQPWTSSSSSSRTIASKTWSPRLTCMPRSSRSASAQTKAGVLSQRRR